MHSILSVFMILFSINGLSFAQWPKDIERCHAGDVQCIGRVTTDIITKYPNGRSDMGLPPIDPFRLESFLLEPNNRTQVSLRLELKNLAIHGLSKAKIEKIVGFEKDPTKSKFEIYTRVPKIRFESNYKSDGRILVAPVHGQGYLDLNMTNVKLSVKFKPNVYNKNGQTYIGVKRIKVLVEPGPSKINFQSSAPNGSALSESLNAFLNDNWNELWKEIYPTFNEALLKIVKELLQNTLRRVPYDELYLS